MIKKLIAEISSKSFQLKLGALVLIVLVSMVLMPGLFTGINPYSTEPMKTASESSGRFIIQKAPFPPQPGIWLGTDELGRHIWPLIVYGTKLTMTLALFIVLARFIIAVPVGFAAGFGGIVSKTFIRQFSLIFGALPALLFSIILLKMPFFMGLEKGASMLAFVAILTLVGWGRLANVIENRVAAILSEPFVQGEIALGKNKVQIAITCVGRHMLPELCVLLFLEMARALTFLLQLGLFSIFVGNIRFIEDVFKGKPIYMNISYEPEWAGMLGSARNNIRVAPWIILFPSLAFFISVLGLNAFGEGLRAVFQSQVETDRTWRSMRRHHKKMILASLIAGALLVVSSTMPYFADQMRFNLGTTGEDLKVIPGLDGTPVAAGTPNGKVTAMWIAEGLKKRGLKPLQNSYVKPYKLPTVYYPKTQNIVLTDDLANKHQLVAAQDYQLMSYGEFGVQGALIDGTKVDLYNEAASTQSFSKPGIVVLDGTQYERLAIRYFNNKLSKLPNIKGLIWLTDLSQLRSQQMGDLSLKVPTLFVDESWTQKLLQKNAKLEIQESFGKAQGDGHNISAFLPAKNTNEGNTYMVYGFSYNALTKEASKKKIDFAFAFIDALKKDANNRNRSVIITFFDGTLNDRLNGMKAYVDTLPFESSKAVLFCDMTRMDGVDKGAFIYSENQSPISRYYAYTFALQFKDKFEKMGLKPQTPVDMIEDDYPLYLKKGIPTLIFGLKEHSENDQAHKYIDSEMTLQKMGTMITSVISRNNY